MSVVSRWQRVAYEYIMVSLGVATTVLAYNCSDPHKIAGGVLMTGHDFPTLMGFSVGMTILIHNIPLFIAVFHFLGPRFD